MTITEIIKSTQVCGDKLRNHVESSFEELIKTLPIDKKSTSEKANKPVRKNHSIQFAALGFLALGIIGWMSTDSDWPKLSIGGGILLSAYDIIRGNNRKKNNHNEYVEEVNPQLSKQDIQKKIKEIIRDVVNEWDEFTNSNKNLINPMIDESSVSYEDKFKAANLISLSRKIQFSILPYVVNIVGAKTANELNLVIRDICAALINDINETVNSQVSDYQSISSTIHQA